MIPQPIPLAQSSVLVLPIYVLPLFSAKQRDELEGSLADLYTSCEFVEKALTHGSETEILLVKKQVRAVLHLNTLLIRKQKMKI